MKRIPLFLAAVLFAAGTAVSNAQTYAIGQSTCSPGGIYCWGVPATNASEPQASFWLDLSNGAHFINFSDGLSDLGTASINLDSSYQPSYGTVTAVVNGRTYTSTQVTSLSLTFYGTDASGNAYNGAMAISFSYYYVATCSGRGCGGTLGWHRRVTGGSFTYAVAQY